MIETILTIFGMGIVYFLVGGAVIWLLLFMNSQ